MKAESHFSWGRVLLILALALALAGVLLFEAFTPLRHVIAKRYVARGDTFMVEQQFDSAAQQYSDALNYDSSLQIARDDLALAEEAPTDIAAARNFYQAHDVQSVLTKLDQAQKQYTDPKQALQVGVGFYQNQDYSYAQYPLALAVQLDPVYSEAWNYLALTYQALAKDNASYRAKADAAFAKRDSLTLKYIQNVP